eukprot:gene20338-22340_t
MGCCSSTNAVHPSNNNIISEEAGQDVKPKDPPISNQQIEIIMKNWKIVEQDPQGNGIKLFKFLFEQNPDIRKKFYFAMESENDIEEIMGDERLARHAKGVIDTISVTVAMLNDLASVVPVLKQLGASHARFNLQPAHFKARKTFHYHNIYVESFVPLLALHYFTFSKTASQRQISTKKPAAPGLCYSQLSQQQ